MRPRADRVSPRSMSSRTPYVFGLPAKEMSANVAIVAGQKTLALAGSGTAAPERIAASTAGARSKRFIASGFASAAEDLFQQGGGAVGAVHAGDDAPRVPSVDRRFHGG